MMFHGKKFPSGDAKKIFFYLLQMKKFNLLLSGFPQVVSLSNNFLKVERHKKNNNLHSEAEEENEKQFMAIFM